MAVALAEQVILLAVFLLGLPFNFENEESTFLRNIGKFLLHLITFQNTLLFIVSIGVVDWIYAHQQRDNWLASLSMVFKFPVP
jgi:hypothetical protein